MFAALRSRNYALFWAGSFVSNVGTWMQTVALGWLIYEMTGSASWLGTVSLAANAPTLFAGLVGGAVTDQADRRVLVVGTQAAAVGLGAVIGGLGLAAFGDVPHKALLAVVAGAILALLLVAFSLAPTLRVATPLLFLLGAVQVNCVASLNTTLQVKVTDSMRGRVVSMLSFALFGLSTLGSVLLGIVGDRIGVASAIRFGGFAVLAVVALVMLRSPTIFEPADEPTRL